MRALGWLIAGAVGVVGGVVVYAATKKAPAPAPASGLPALKGLSPIPIPRASSGSVTVWLPIAPSGDVFDVTQGTTYRATAQVDTTSVSVTAAKITSYVDGQGFQTLHVYGPTDTLPADWPDRRAGQNVWYVEAKRTGASGSIPTSAGVDLVLVAVEGQVLSLFDEQTVSATAPALEVSYAQATTTVQVVPGDVVRVRTSVAAYGSAWQWEEVGSIASIVAQSTDPKTGDLLTDLVVGAGDAVIIAAMVDTTRNILLNELVFGLHAAAAAPAPPAPAKNAA